VFPFSCSCYGHWLDLLVHRSGQLVALELREALTSHPAHFLSWVWHLTHSFHFVSDSVYSIEQVPSFTLRLTDWFSSQIYRFQSQLAAHAHSCHLQKNSDCQISHSFFQMFSFSWQVADLWQTFLPQMSCRFLLQISLEHRFLSDLPSVYLFWHHFQSPAAH